MQLLSFITIMMVINALGITINTPVTYTSDVAFINNIVIEPGGVLTIQNCTIQFVVNKGIVIKDGGRLVLSNATLSGTSSLFNSRWEGIQVNDDADGIPDVNGNVAVHATDSRIFNAHKGIFNELAIGNSTKGKSIHINGCEFKDNSIHIEMKHKLSNWNSGTQHIYINDSKFHGGTAIVDGPIYSLHLDKVKRVTIANSEFKSHPIETHLTNLSASCIMLNKGDDISIFNNYFNHQYRIGIHMQHVVKDFRITQNTFESADYINQPWNYPYNFAHASNPIHVNGSDFPDQVGHYLEISNNEFFLESASCPYEVDAIRAEAVYDNALISENKFTDILYGILKSSLDVYNGNFEILDNDFDRYKTAIHINDHSHKFSIHCNTFREGHTALDVGVCEHPIDFQHSNNFLGSQIGIRSIFPAPFLYGVAVVGSFPSTVGNVVPTPISNDKQPCGPRRMMQEQPELEVIQNNNVLSISNLEEPSTISIVNALGQRIAVFKTEESGLDIDISNYTKGIYFVNVDGKTPTSFKFMR